MWLLLLALAGSLLLNVFQHLSNRVAWAVTDDVLGLYLEVTK